MTTAVTLHPRRSMTKARRTRIAERQHGLCACGCGGALGASFDVDHVLALWMGGTDADDNLEGLTEGHHKIKTRADAAARAKVKRLIAKEDGTARKPNRTIASRPFGKSSRKIVGRGFERRAK